MCKTAVDDPVSTLNHVSRTYSRHDKNTDNVPTHADSRGRGRFSD